MKKILLFVVVLIFPSIVCAWVFSPPPTDKSVNLLGAIFGGHIGPVYLGNVINPALERMFQSLNAVVVTIGTIIVSYTGIVSTINTAQEGKAMGRKFASIWIPLRSVLGIALIAPTPASGYSLIQASVIWLIMNGIGAADNIWNNVLHDLGKGLGASAAMQKVPDTRDFTKLRFQAIDLSEDLLNSAVCMHSLNQTKQISKLGGIRRFNIDNKDFSSGTTYVGIPWISSMRAICGSYNISARVDKNEWPAEQRRYIGNDLLKNKAAELYLQKKISLQTAFDLLNPLALSIVNQSARPRDENNRLRKPFEDELFTPSGFKRYAVNSYVSLMRKMVKPENMVTVHNIVQNGRQNGWISAGSFYFVLNHQKQLELFDTVTSDNIISHNIPRCNNYDNCTIYLESNNNTLSSIIHERIAKVSDKQQLARYLWDANVYFSNDLADVEDTLQLSYNHEPTRIVERNTKQRDIVNSLMNLLSNKDDDALIAQGRFGAQLLVDSEQPWLQKIAEANVRLMRALQEDQAVGPEVLQQINELIKDSSFSLNIFTIVWVMGAILAIYIPLIPYMMFIVGALGWFLLVIEAVVAAPILALGFMLPTGEELGKIMQGLLLLLNIMLRPALMLFGFILSTRLYNVIIHLVHFSIGANFEHLQTSESVLAWVAILAIYIGFVLALANKCFALIYALPDKILRWMGGAPEHTDAQQELQHAKGALSKGGDMAVKIPGAYAKGELAKLQQQTNLLSPADAVRGGPQ